MSRSSPESDASLGRGEENGHVAETDAIDERISRLGIPFNEYGIDPYGISKTYLRWGMRLLHPLYRSYFKVETYGIEHVPPRGRAMLVGNHSGGFALDAAMVLAAMFFSMDPPRLAQGMADKFIYRLPVASLWASRMGQMTGLPEHCVRLLEDERLLLVFPEGARGTAKLYGDRYTLVTFGTGFLRQALQTKTPIIPFGFLGGGEALPTIANSYTLGKILGLPYVPITPYGLPFPLPTRMQIRFGAPLSFEGTGSEEDAVLGAWVAEVKTRIASLIEEGRA
jgi:1-acyl-sn-glycerol-3-phosphate acyltransferase